MYHGNLGNIYRILGHYQDVSLICNNKLQNCIPRRACGSSLEAPASIVSFGMIHQACKLSSIFSKHHFAVLPAAYHAFACVSSLQ